MATGSIETRVGVAVAGVPEQLEEGREAYERQAWKDAYEALTLADRAASLGPDDLGRLAIAGFMLGLDDESRGFLERAHHAYVDAGAALPAVRCAFWIGMTLAIAGEMGPATGWLGRAQRLLDREEKDSVEHGYLLLPNTFELEARGDWEAAAATLDKAAEIGRRFDDSDLAALAAHEHGHILIRHGRVREGLALQDEAMVAVTAGELSPIVTGIVYCGVILACQEIYEVRRAGEWTAALSRWAEQQPDLVAFTGRCLVHRAEIMQLQGAWPAALEEAKQAVARFAETMNPAVGVARYRQGELHRLQGQFAASEEAYREARRSGWEPQPGLALLRLAQGQSDAAAAAIRRVVGETTQPLKLAAILPAYVEIMLAVGEAREAREACSRLEEIAQSFESAMLDAMVAHARGAVALADGDERAALVELRQALQAWQGLEAPYEAGRSRVLLGLACRALGDEDAAALELEAAREAFGRLGAGPDRAQVDMLTLPVAAADTHGLTPRELEVLRLVAAGNSNRDIAAALVISEHTVARHLQNIFAKLDVSSRTAAGAFAFEHDLV